MIPSMRDALIIPINEYMQGIPVIQSNQEGEPPEGTHIIFTAIVQFAQANFTPYFEYEQSGEELVKNYVEGYKFTVSFTVISGTEEEATTVAFQLRKWFAVIGDDALDAIGLVVDNISDIINRNSFDEDEQRQGFDVIFSAVQITPQIVEWFDTIKVGS